MKHFLFGGALAAVMATTIMADENASNPLAAVNNTDLRNQVFDLGDADRQDLLLDSAYMLRLDLKLKYGLHYNAPDIT